MNVAALPKEKGNEGEGDKENHNDGHRMGPLERVS